MNEMTEAMTKITASVRGEEWRERIEACQSSGMRVKDWPRSCRENSGAILTSMPYFCSAGDSVIGSKASCGRMMDSFCYIKDWTTEHFIEYYSLSSSSSIKE